MITCEQCVMHRYDEDYEEYVCSARSNLLVNLSSTCGLACTELPPILVPKGPIPREAVEELANKFEMFEIKCKESSNHVFNNHRADWHFAAKALRDLLRKD